MRSCWTCPEVGKCLDGRPRWRDGGVGIQENPFEIRYVDHLTKLKPGKSTYQDPLYKRGSGISPF